MPAALVSSILLIAIGASAAETGLNPVGLVTAAGGGKLVRAGSETALSARAGDLLFPGDILRTEGSESSFLFCPEKAVDTLSAPGEVRFEPGSPKVKTGKISTIPARACTLPQTLRVATASQQHYGVTMTRGTNTVEYPPVARDKFSAALLAELAPIEAGLAADANDVGALTAQAAAFEKYQLPANAVAVYYKLRTLLPETVWLKSKIFELEEGLATQAAAAAATATGGNTFALVIGVSKYQKPELTLQFAHADAADFARMLESPRGGGVPKENVLLLTDEKATLAAVRNGFQDFLKRRATKNDTVIILIAGHGTVEKPGSGAAYILSYDADPQDLASTALPVAELQSLFADQLKRVGRVLLFADICKAGTIGSIQNTTVAADVQHLGDEEGDLFGLLASRPREVSREGPQFGGGHGVFSYYVLKGLQGEADANKNFIVDAAELIEYVSAQVPMATENKQHPREFGAYENSMRMSEISKPGIELARYPAMEDARTGGALLLAQQAGAALTPAAAAAQARFDAALAQGALLPDQAGNAFDALQGVAPARQREAANRLQVALEDKAQQVLLQYLAGDAVPQTRDAFAQGAQYMEAARRITRESLLLEGREDFFAGRALLFDKQYAAAADRLEQSVRLDPEAGYGYNALGIAYLEQAQFDKAIPALRDAARKSQHWAYPLHNLALAYTEVGDTNRAIRAYQDAIRLAPAASYLPYNLGLVYQRANRRRDAERSYLEAVRLAPNSAEPYNALGTLKAAERRDADAERYYRQALDRDPRSLAARNNLALLLSAQPQRRTEAITLWRANLAQAPDHLPSRLSLAQTLEQQGDRAGAGEEYRNVLNIRPNYLAARLELARLLAATGTTEDALAELRKALLDPGGRNADVYERIGDLEAARSRRTEAQAAYGEAAQLAEGSQRKRINKKLSANR